MRESTFAKACERFAVQAAAGYGVLLMRVVVCLMTPVRSARAALAEMPPVVTARVAKPCLSVFEGNVIDIYVTYAIAMYRVHLFAFLGRAHRL